MTALEADRLAVALEPLRAELLRRARAEAQRIIGEAENEAARIVEQARDTARALTERARAAGESGAAAVVAAQGAAQRRALRREVLAARNDAYQQWRQLGLQAVLALRDEPGHFRRQEILRKTAYAVLGADAHVADHTDGGIVGVSDRRRLDLSLSAIAEHALDHVASEADSLWA